MIFNMLYGSAGETIPVKGDSYDLTTRTLGSIVKWNNAQWIIVDITDNIYVLALQLWGGETKFGTNSTYAGSELEKKCITYEQQTAYDSIAIAIETSVHNTSHKIYVPESTCFCATCKAGQDTTSLAGAGLYKYYSDNAHRICRDRTGKEQYYYTASNWSTSSTMVWYVDTDGSLLSGGGTFGGVSGPNGFRPHVRIQL